MSQHFSDTKAAAAAPRREIFLPFPCFSRSFLLLDRRGIGVILYLSRSRRRGRIRIADFTKFGSATARVSPRTGTYEGRPRVFSARKPLCRLNSARVLRGPALPADPATKNDRVSCSKSAEPLRASRRVAELHPLCLANETIRLASRDDFHGTSRALAEGKEEISVLGKALMLMLMDGWRCEGAPFATCLPGM